MWKPCSQISRGIACYNFSCDGIIYCLDLEVGETVYVQEECEGWYRGISSRSSGIRGIFPSSYIHLRENFSDDCNWNAKALDDPVVRESASVLREWGEIWKDLYVNLPLSKSGNPHLWETLRKAILELCEWRKLLVNGTLTLDQITQLKLRITRKIDWGNRKLGLDLVPRIGGEMVDSSSISAVELFNIHYQSAEASQHHSSGINAATLQKFEKGVENYHLFFCMQDFCHQIGEAVEIFFSLYNASSSKSAFISERFLVKHPKEGFNNYVERPKSSCTIFSDLGKNDLACDLYIVAHIVRVGKMISSDNTKKGSIQHFRRPYGVAVFKLSPLALKSEPKEVELIGKVQTTDEKDIWQLVDFMVKKQSNKFSPTFSNSSIVINIRLLEGDLRSLMKEHRLLLKDVCVTRKLGFADVIMPGEFRNDFYVTISHGEFEKGGKSVGKNIEVTVIASDLSGHPVQCLYSGTGHKGSSEFFSTILYHNNSPHWNESIKIALPVDKFSKTHLRFEFRHCSTREKGEKKLLGFSFIRLMEDEGGTTLRNGEHDLCVYKCEDPSRILVPVEYLNSPYNAKQASECIYALPFQRCAREIFVIQTLLCSTKLTQNVDLLSLLRWKSTPSGIGEILRRLNCVDGAETVKFLQDVLDALFSMFSTEDGNSTPYSGHVFHALVFIFNLLEDAKFRHFRPVMDAYISNHFAAALVYKGLIRCVKHLSDLCAQADKQDAILNCFCSLEYIFKFIIQSRLLFTKATGGQSEEPFKSDIEELFESLAQLLANTSEHILYTQVALLNHIQGACTQLYRIFSVIFVLRYLNSLLYAISIDAPNPIVQAKLNAIQNAISPQVFGDPECRGLFLRMSTDHLRHHLMTKQELPLCAEVLSKVVLTTYKHMALLSFKNAGNFDQDITTVVAKMLDVVTDVILSLDISHSSYGLFIALMVGIFQAMSKHHYASLWEMKVKDGKNSHLKQLLISFIKLFEHLIKSAVFPPDWMAMKMVTNRCILMAMTEFANPLTSFFLSDSFDCQLWTSYFDLSVCFFTQPSLQLEHFSISKREHIMQRYGDMRVQIGYLVLFMWHKLDIQKINSIPSMVGPFLEFTLIPDVDLRKATLPIFFDMMQAEQMQKGNFKQVETELIDKLDILVSENKGDDEYRHVFNTILLERVKAENSSWCENGAAFVHSVTRLLERLLDYRSVMQGDENLDKRMRCTVNLLNFYKNEINRHEMYIRYIYKLADLHLPAGNYTEAAFTLKLHAKELSWCPRMLHADHLYQGQTEFQRKEMIYYRIIEYFNRGKCWEEGISLLEELAEKYKLQNFNYKKLYEVYQQLATFYKNILFTERYENEYFRVGFYGRGLPLFVRNKVFIYRGLEYESISAFTQRLQAEFPHSKLLSHNTPPDDLTKSADEQFIQICAVKPKPEFKPEFEGNEIDPKILTYYCNNRVKKFVLDRPCHRGSVDKDNEFKNLWVERITYETESELPGILKWFEVINEVSEEICPPQYACEMVKKNVSQIKQMTSHYRLHPKENIQPFTMRLQGSIDAAVNGGISKYHDAFFRREYLQKYPQFNEWIFSLKTLMMEQTEVLEAALDLHGKIAPSVNQPLHNRLVEVFESLQEKVKTMCYTPHIQYSTTSLHSISSRTLPSHHRRSDSDTAVEFRRIGSIINSPLPPLPSESKEDFNTSISTSGHSSQRSSLSSNLYSHFQSIYHDDELYSKPLENDEIVDNNLTEPRDQFSYDSIGSSPVSFSHSNIHDFVAASSPKTSLCESQRNSSNLSNPSSLKGLSWSEPQGSYEVVPPIPPKSVERSLKSSSLNDEELPPPIYPKKLSKRNYSESSVNRRLQYYSSPPLLSPRNQKTPSPPPIPPKGCSLVLSETPSSPPTKTQNETEDDIAAAVPASPLEVAVISDDDDQVEGDVDDDDVVLSPASSRRSATPISTYDNNYSTPPNSSQIDRISTKSFPF